MGEIQWAGSEKAMLNVKDTGAKDVGVSSEKDVVFAGDGDKDVRHSIGTTTEVKPVPGPSLIISSDTVRK